jgi:uncharacterized protein (UPF0548 family)
MLRLTRAGEATVERLVEVAKDAPPSSPALLALANGPIGPPPPGFAHDLSRTELGHCESFFQAGRDAFRRWEQFDLGWVRIANSRPAIIPGELVAVEIHTAFVWSVNFSRITEVVDTSVRFGFLYTTTSIHVEEGQERFVLQYDADSGCVSYLIEAVSRPRHFLARIAYPFSRAMQHRFARDSQSRMLRSVAASAKPGWVPGRNHRQHRNSAFVPRNSQLPTHSPPTRPWREELH